jgi:hypothetical protein
LLGKQHEFSVVAGAPVGMSQLKDIRTPDVAGLRQKPLFRITEMEKCLIKIQQSRPQVFQVNMAKLANP